MGEATDAGGSDGRGGADSASEDWLQDIIDAFATAYGWGKRQILDELYPEEIPALMERIAKRQRDEALQRVADWKMALRIAIAPHTKDGVEVQAIQRDLSQMERALKEGRQTQQGVVDMEFHRSLIELNKRRRARREAG